jgi:DNA-binding MarR family transcriptional regulator
MSGQHPAPDRLRRSGSRGRPSPTVVISPTLAPAWRLAETVTGDMSESLLDVRSRRIGAGAHAAISRASPETPAQSLDCLTMTTPSDALSTATALATAARRGSTGLTLPQVALLRALIESGPLRITALSERQGVRVPTTTAAVTRLEKAGLVARSGDPRDLRVVLVTVTDLGRQRCQAALAELSAGLSG